MNALLDHCLRQASTGTQVADVTFRRILWTNHQSDLNSLIQWTTESGLLKSYRQVNLILLRMAHPATIEAPSGRGSLIDVRLWGVG